MSWDAYVQEQMLATQCVSAGGIYSRENGEPWAQSGGFNAEAKDVSALASALGSGNCDALCDGVHLNGKKYMFLRGDTEAILFKRGQDGGVAVVTDKAVLIGLYEEGTTMADCHQVVGKLADYLQTQGA